MRILCAARALALAGAFVALLDPGERLRVHAGHIGMQEPTVQTDIQMVRGFRNVLFGGEGLFLATLTRLPTDRERRAFDEYRQSVTERRAAFTDTLWALINTREFILNH